MSNAITISGSEYTISGTVKKDKKGVLDLHVEVYDNDPIKDDFLGIGVTDATGSFSICFDSSKFTNFLDREPDLYFVVIDYGMELLSTKERVINNATEATPPINLVVDKLNTDTRDLINETPVDGWVGGFGTPDPSALPMLKNMENMELLKRQQKVVWPEFSWASEPKATEPKRCFQMFAPDISRLGYTNEGRVYSIICPQQGYATEHFGSLNVEVTVTGNRGWADESNKTVGAEMKVTGKIWFAPSSYENKFMQIIKAYFTLRGLPFPADKDHAIEVQTFKPGFPSVKEFPLVTGLSPEFPIPEFAQHKEISWSMGSLGVQIGTIKPTGVEKVDKFNQLVLEIFNTAGGNMLKEGNILYWNVWFTAPEEVAQTEWHDHAEHWRKSIQVDHGAPDGQGTIARYFDGTPFKPLRNLAIQELPKILAYIKGHIDID
ncbi:MAG: hypothetical protein ACI93P_002061 [bacterium]|jgi:hypothetical protein